MAKKRNKVRVQIEHPDFKADCVISQSKALDYLKRIKKALKTNISVVTTVLTPEELSKLKLSTTGPMKTIETEEEFRLRIEKTFEV